MFKFRGFKASLNFAYTNKNKDDIENYPTGPENISLAGAYRTNREEFFGYGSLSEPPKKITPAMVKLPPSRNQPTNLTIQPSKSTSDLAQPSATLPPEVLRKSTPDISTDPRGRTTNETRNSIDFHTNKEGKKPTSKEQKLLERQKKKQKKIAEEKEAKLKKEREKAEKERERLQKERVREQKAVKKEKKTKSKAPPLPKTPPPTAVENPLVILDQTPNGSQMLTQTDTFHQSPQHTSQQPKTNPLAQVSPTPLATFQPPTQAISQSPPPAASQPTKVNQSPKPKTNQQPKSTKQKAAPSQPKAAQRANPLVPSPQNYSSGTLDSNISRNTGPPPYDEVIPNTNDKAGNTSFGKRIDDTNNSWDLVSQHRQQMNKPMAKERRPKRLVMDLQFDSGFVQNKGDENSEA